MRGALQKDPKYIRFVSSALFSPHFITVCDNKRSLKIRQMTGCAHLQMASRLSIENTCFQNAVKVFQKPHSFRRVSMRTCSKIASVLFMALDSAAGKSSRLQVLQITSPVSSHSERLLVLKQFGAVHHVMFNLASCCSRQRDCRDHYSQR